MVVGCVFNAKRYHESRVLSREFMQKIANFSQKVLTTMKQKSARFGRFFKSSKPWLQSGVLIGLGLIVVGFFAFTLYAAYVSRDLPDPNVLLTRDVAQSTKIYDRTGTKLLYEIHGDEKRTLIKIEDIPDYAKWATIALEDRQFYEHHGIYWRGLIRAVVMSVLKGQRIQGTSTLTQQLVKNALLTNERTLDRKIRELILSLQIERRFTKDQILQLYMNEIPYGSTLYGIEAASQTYFGKSAKDLTLDEAALLASIPQQPEFFNPYGTGYYGDNRDALVARQHHDLDLLAEQGHVTQEEADAAKQVDTIKKILPRTIGDIHAPHFVMYVRSQLVEKYGQKAVEQGGLNVITTLDYDKQAAAEEEVAKGVEDRGERYGFSNAALISLDPKTGEVLAMVGSKDFFDNENDGQVNVTLRPRQPGSSFKPIVYAAGFARGYLPSTTLWDVTTVFKTDAANYTPRDYSLKEIGPVSIRQALAGSLNIPAVKMLYLVGIGRTLDLAEQLGYTTLQDRSRFGLSLVLGGGEVKPIEHASAFGVFANNGVRVPTASILKVTDPDGNVLEEWQKPEGQQVLEPQVAQLLNDVLSDNNARAYIFGSNNRLTLPDRPVAAKTGTTNDFHDAWVAGYTPNLVSVVWVGNNDNTKMKSGADGSIVASPIWQNYMKRATKDMPVENFQKPSPSSTTKPVLLGNANEQTVQVNRLTGKLAGPNTPPELIEDRTGYVAHNILYYIDKEDPLGPPPTNPAADPQFSNWEGAVQAWVQEKEWHTTSTVPTEVDNQYSDEFKPSLRILFPTNDSVVTNRLFPISVEVSAQRPLAHVDAYLENQLIGTSYNAPWTIQASAPNWIEKGFRTLTVKAYDDIGNQREESIQINLTADPRVDIPNIEVVSPSANTIWSRTEFPKDIQFRMDNPSSYNRVNVSFIGSDGVDRLIGFIENPSEPTASIHTTLGPPQGSYRLVIKGFHPDGSSVEASVPITIVP